jgi:hypothetical protein
MKLISQGPMGVREGLGAEYKNDVFEMHPYHWGDCECGLAARAQKWHAENLHKPECLHTELMAMEFPDGYGGRHREATTEQLQALYLKHHLLWRGGKDEFRSRCDCGHREESIAWHRDHGHAPECPVGRPNFRCGDIEVRWYKYIGRGMSLNREVKRHALETMFQRCRGSLPSPRP